jgi:hypothetical protein
VQEKARANFCEWFLLRAGAYRAKDESPSAKAKADLDALFGGARPEAENDPARMELDKLFGNKSKD